MDTFASLSCCASFHKQLASNKAFRRHVAKLETEHRVALLWQLRDWRRHRLDDVCKACLWIYRPGIELGVSCRQLIEDFGFDAAQAAFVGMLVNNVVEEDVVRLHHEKTGTWITLERLDPESRRRFAEMRTYERQIRAFVGELQDLGHCIEDVDIELSDMIGASSELEDIVLEGVITELRADDPGRACMTCQDSFETLLDEADVDWASCGQAAE